MASAMRPFDPARRDLLKLGSTGLAASAAAALPAFAAPRKEAAAPSTPMLFDVRVYGATGDGKTIDSPAINKAIEVEALSFSLAETTYASRSV